MKVAVICLSRFGGTLHCGRRLAYGLSTLPEVSSVLFIGSRNADYGGHDALDASGVRQFLIHTGENLRENIIGALRLTRHLAIKREIDEFRPDVIHYAATHVWNISLMFFLRGFPSVVTVHDPIRHLGAESSFFAALAGYEIAMTDRALMLCNALRNDLRRFGRPPEEVDTVPHGELGIEEPCTPLPRQHRLCFVGRIEPYKGISLLLESFSIVLKQLPSASLTIAGRGTLPPFARSANLTVINRWLSESEENGTITSSDVVVLPYIEATQSGVIAKAQSLGRPVVITRVGGLPEQIIDGETGLTVPALDANALAAALVTILTDDERAQAMGAAARKLYETDFSWPRVAEAAYSAYVKAAGKRRRAKAFQAIRNIVIGLVSRR